MPNSFNLLEKGHPVIFPVVFPFLDSILSTWNSGPIAILLIITQAPAADSVLSDYAVAQVN